MDHLKFDHYVLGGSQNNFGILGSLTRPQEWGMADPITYPCPRNISC